MGSCTALLRGCSRVEPVVVLVAMAGLALRPPRSSRPPARARRTDRRRGWMEMLFGSARRGAPAPPWPPALVGAGAGATRGVARSGGVAMLGSALLPPQHRATHLSSPPAPPPDWHSSSFQPPPPHLAQGSARPPSLLVPDSPAVQSQARNLEARSQSGGAGLTARPSLSLSFSLSPHSDSN